MTLIEFLSLNITYGQKVNLKLSLPCYGKDKITSIVCFFSGFRNFAMKTKVVESNDIIPVFNKVAKNGKMKNEHLDLSTNLEYIKSISPMEDSPVILGADESAQMERVYANLNDSALVQVKGILKEMSVLFPGKKIHFGEKPYDSRRPVAYAYQRYGCDTGEVVAAGWKDGAPVFDLSLSSSFEEDQHEEDFHIDSVLRLRTILLESIENPVSSENKNNFFEPDTDSFETVPEINEEDFPALYQSGALDTLKANKWFESLDENEKATTFDSLKARYHTAVDEGSKESFIDFINDFWGSLEPYHKKLFLKKGE